MIHFAQLEVTLSGLRFRTVAEADVKLRQAMHAALLPALEPFFAGFWPDITIELEFTVGEEDEETDWEFTVAEEEPEA